MLTNDLVRVRVVKQEVRPQYVDPADSQLLDLAGSLLELFRQHQGRSKGSLDAELAELLGTGTTFQLHRGLAKLLFDRCELDTRSEAEPVEVRELLFSLAAKAWRGDSAGEELRGTTPRREELVAAVGQRLGITPEQVEAALYADLKSEQVLSSFDDLSAPALLDRYNLALAQAVLLRARELTLELGDAEPRTLRAVLSKLKFHQLLYRVKRRPEGWRVSVDGPLSLFSANSRYGMQMASFLPALISLPHWGLEARILWGKSRRTKRFRLDPSAGLKSKRSLRGTWRPEELGYLPQRFAKLGTPWVLDLDVEPMDLGDQGVLIPDYVFRHPRGTVVHMEVFGYWNRGAVAKRVQLLRRRGPKNLILALSKSLAGDGESLADLPSEVYVFRTAPVAREVVKRLDAFLEPSA
ncbi:MAG: DUF790 family protein [Acidobacteriota bacterium]